MTARAIMLQGTGSDVGKSLAVAGLCRALMRRGYSVRPFKPQNMSNNAAVTPGGGEIGRAQALQARACGIAPTVHMNPVLLKPQSDIGAQLVVLGEVRGNYSARDFQPFKQSLMPGILESFETLKAEADFVIVEGAGSAAEINLRKNDIANMGFALAADVPVVLVADIDRGGVIASLVGTWTLLPEDERALLKGFIVNKFRGDISLFDDGVTIIAKKTGLKSLGVLPHLPAARRLPDEDAMALENREHAASEQGVKIAVPRLAHIANFDDFDPLLAEPGVELVMVPRGQPLPGDAALVILPGSKTTIADMEDFRAQGWDIDLKAHVRRGGQVLGICAGYQMLGRCIIDSGGIEGAPGETAGLGLLQIETRLGGDKTLAEVEGTASGGLGRVHGYEMHMGQSSGADTVRPFLELGDEDGGAVSEDGCVMGCYLHGLFSADNFRTAFLARLGGSGSGLAYEKDVEAALDELADAMESHLDLDGLAALAR
ncbi:MAG: cobyric acid synthase [Rhodospirillaceae bacterium]|jgi:adenosylcobyric acid synthase|nr:cobyric acid synthase [Rhodospirillaceae bacterium]MBT3884656.1 cobyric acid synthase [Rhodospirillaceae bacterium]MBT4115012.1 cobyric acid synthase [Rhodospirillaceae bacterium]MBT4671396.1 cobyric acid synthase [Rhodospirillaceae bacterium]MBT4721462.1 cobyric acid synthase [Rhodospirillaceae bacterium]